MSLTIWAIYLSSICYAIFPWPQHTINLSTGGQRSQEKSDYNLEAAYNSWSSGKMYGITIENIVWVKELIARKEEIDEWFPWPEYI